MTDPKNTKSKLGSEELSSAFAQIEVRPPLMISCSLERRPEAEPQDENEEAPQRFYNATMQRLTTHEQYVLAVVEFSAGENCSDREKDADKDAVIETFKFSAAYIVGAKIVSSLSASDQALCIEHLTKGGAWARFKDMFALVVTQTEGELPALPQTPKIRWKKPSEATSKVAKELRKEK